jgi:tetratricopeptide (TPR) repeat protein
VAAPKMSRHDMKQDDLVNVLEKTKSYIDKNPMMLRNLAIAAGAAFVLVAGFAYWRSSNKAGASELASKANAQMTAPVVAGSADPSSQFAPSYASEADRDKAALESYTKLADQYGSRPEGKVARYYEGLLLARVGKDQEAEAALEKFVSGATSPLLADIARAQIAEIHSKRGDFDGAAKVFSELAENKASAYPRDWALYYLAGTQEQQGKKDEAAKTYALIVKEFPNSTFGTEAARKAKGV